MSRYQYKLTRTSKWILTDEDWYPTVNEKVEASLLRLINGQWRVCVWGGDDFGLEKDFAKDSRQDAKQLYTDLVDFTTQQQMIDWGMINA